MITPLNQARGRANQKRGASAERQVLDELRASGGWAVQVPPPLRVLGPSPSVGKRPADPRVVLARLESPCAPDLLGATAQGRALALEVKLAVAEAHRVSWPLDGRLRGHQGQALSEIAARSGVAAVVLWRDDGWGGQLYLIPWPKGDPRPSRVSWAWSEIERWRVPRGAAWPLALGRWGEYCEEGWPPPATPVYQIPLEGLAGRRLVATEAAAQAAYLESPTDEDSDSKLESLQAQLLAARRDEVRSDRLTGATVRIGQLVELIAALKRTRRRKDR